MIAKHIQESQAKIAPETTIFRIIYLLSITYGPILNSNLSYVCAIIRPFGTPANPNTIHDIMATDLNQEGANV